MKNWRLGDRIIKQYYYRMCYCKILWFVSILQISHLPQPLALALPNNWSAHHWQITFVQPPEESKLATALTNIVYNNKVFQNMAIQYSSQQELVYTTQVNSTFRACWLASSEVISQVLFTFVQLKNIKMGFVCILSQIRLLLGLLVIQLVWYILKQQVSVKVVDIYLHFGV